MAAGSDRQLARNRAEDLLDLGAKADQDRNGADRDKSQNEGVFHERLTMLALAAQGSPNLCSHALLIGVGLHIFNQIRPEFADNWLASFK
jgi:hypothetical protein